MSLQEMIQNQLIVATKKKDAVHVGTLRMLRAAIKNREVELQAGLDDQEILRLIRTQIKQRKEAIHQFKKGGRDDLVNKEERELSVLMSYLPEQHSPEAINDIVTGVIQELGAKDLKDMGRVMKTVMGQLAGSADGSLVNEIVRKHLGR
ncbi:MAG: GatB/YqeY domain-containing protein [Desulfobacterales bacterium]|nr:GatB/YqeY domain-containing protein [Desulfobacterales bacterium]